MTDRRLSLDLETGTSEPEHDANLRHLHGAGSRGLSERIARPHSREAAEERYVAARDAWAAAMRQASSGRPADLAALAIAQEDYEAALAERERWASGSKVAIPIEPDRPGGIEAVVGQEMSWRQVHEQESEKSEKPKGLRRLFRRKSRS